MNRNKFVFSFAWVVALLVATPAMGQLNNFPILALPSGESANTLGGGFGRGLNDQSGKNNSFVVGYGRTGESVSFNFLGGWVLDQLVDGRTGINFGSNVSYFIVDEEDSGVSVGLQVGLEYGSVNTDPRTNRWNFPVGVSISGSSEGSNAVRYWVMPRINHTRSLQRDTTPVVPSTTFTDFGTSLGISLQNEGGVGVGAYLDWLLTDDGTGTDSNGSQMLFGIAVFYTIQ